MVRPHKSLLPDRGCNDLIFQLPRLPRHDSLYPRAVNHNKNKQTNKTTRTLVSHLGQIFVTAREK